MSFSTDDVPLSRGLIVACLPRSGTLSVAKALQILGYKNVFHTHLVTDDPFPKLREAMWAHSETLNKSIGRPVPLPWTRKDWDQACGQYEAVTEAWCTFTIELADAYPDAKVLVVESDPVRWAASMDEIYLQRTVGSWYGKLVRLIAAHFTNNEAEAARWDFVRHFLEGNTISEMRANLPRIHEKYFDDVAAKITADRKLMFNHKQGWEPLCQFLGKPVPDVPYPHVNERKALLEKRRRLYQQILWTFYRKVAVFSAATSILTVSVWLAKRKLL